MTLRVLCVCLGNICRSPLAQAVLGARAQAAGLELVTDSAGTGGWHVGDPPDPRAQAAGAARGYDLGAQRARRLAPEDFHRFDLILGMDAENLRAIEAFRPAGTTADVALFDTREVPDPYYSGDFEGALDQIESAAERQIAQLQRLAASAPKRS